MTIWPPHRTRSHVNRGVLTTEPYLRCLTCDEEVCKPSTPCRCCEVLLLTERAEKAETRCSAMEARHDIFMDAINDLRSRVESAREFGGRSDEWITATEDAIRAIEQAFIEPLEQL